MKNKADDAGPDYEILTAADKALASRLVKGGVTRRDSLKFSMATGLSVASAGYLLSEAAEVRAVAPRKGGSVRVASSSHGPQDQLDPVLLTTSIDYSRARATYNNLIQYGNDLTPQPELATSFESNRNATRWIFKIRKGVRFHNGKKMTADDVIYSMRRHQGEDSRSVIKTVLASVGEWKKTGSHEVRAIMTAPNTDLPALLATFQVKIVPEGTTGGGTGTGPFVLESFEPGIRSVHVRNDDYWRDGPNLDAIEITAITDPVARVNALISGDMQMVMQVEPKAFRQVENAPGVSLLSTPAASQMGICCLKNTEPGSNDDFVKGMQYIQDRDRIVKRILKGKGTIGNDTPISPAHGADFCSELPQRPYDPDKSRFHFNRSGYESAELFVSPVISGIEDTCLLAQANCARIGFDLKLKRVPTDGYWGSVWMKEPINVTTWNMRSTVNAQIAIQFAPDAPWNDTYWRNDRLGKLLSISLAEIDPLKRHELYCEMQTLIHDHSGMVIPAFINYNDGVSDKVKGIPTVPFGSLGGHEWPEFVWLDE